jgi:hypothetical protein
LADWDALYAQIVTATGWNWGQVDALTIPRYCALLRYWREFPPTHLLLRALFGFTPKTMAAPQSRRGAPTPFETLAALAPDGTLNLSALAKQ